MYIQCPGLLSECSFGKIMPLVLGYSEYSLIWCFTSLGIKLGEWLKYFTLSLISLHVHALKKKGLLMNPLYIFTYCQSWPLLTSKTPCYGVFVLYSLPPSSLLCWVLLLCSISEAILALLKSHPGFISLLTCSLFLDTLTLFHGLWCLQATNPLIHIFNPKLTSELHAHLYNCIHDIVTQLLYRHLDVVKFNIANQQSSLESSSPENWILPPEFPSQ